MRTGTILLSRASTLVLATVVIGANLLIDLIYPYLDPRVRYR